MTTEKPCNVNITLQVNTQPFPAFSYSGQGKRNREQKTSKDWDRALSSSSPLSPLFCFVFAALLFVSAHSDQLRASSIGLNQWPFFSWTHLIPSLSGHLQSSPAVPWNCFFFSFFDSIRRIPFVDRHLEPFPTLSALKKVECTVGDSQSRHGHEFLTKNAVVFSFF